MSGKLRSAPLPGVTWRSAERRAVAGATSSAGAPSADEVAIEEPLEIRVAGDPVAITMRTPGHDRELAIGFLYAEGVVRSIDDVGSVAVCGRPGEGFGNVIEVLPGPGTVLAPERIAGARRGTLTSAACGVCGRLTIDDLLARCTPLASAAPIAASALRDYARAMRGEQRVFGRTGGVHAAALFDRAGGPPIVREDVGRHNAVDKAVGSLIFARGLPARDKVLVVSGRASFEIVQKAVVAGIPVVASISAASSLAIDLAARTNVTLVAFLREETLTVYAGADRVTS